MHIKLPILIHSSTTDVFEQYKDVLNKVVELEFHDKDVLKGEDGINFINIGMGINSQYIGFYYDNTKKINNDDIVKALLEDKVGVFKNEKDAINYLDNLVSSGVKKKYIKDVNINYIINQLNENNSYFNCKSKNKLK